MDVQAFIWPQFWLHLGALASPNRSLEHLQGAHEPSFVPRDRSEIRDCVDTARHHLCTKPPPPPRDGEGEPIWAAYFQEESKGAPLN